VQLLNHPLGGVAAKLTGWLVQYAHYKHFIKGKTMFTLKEITTDTMLHKCINLKVTEEQNKFVASNIYSLAQAWQYREIARPFCIYNDEAMVGFVMLAWEEAEKKCEIWRFMIDAEHQGKGYAKQAMKIILEHIKSNPVFEMIYLTVAPNNSAAIKLYESLGFYNTGEETDYNEIVMVLKSEQHGACGQ